MSWRSRIEAIPRRKIIWKTREERDQDVTLLDLKSIWLGTQGDCAVGLKRKKCPIVIWMWLRNEQYNGVGMDENK